MEEEKDDLFIDDSQRNLANIKKATWSLFKNNPYTGGIGSLANIVLDQNEMGDLELTKPKYLEAIPVFGEALYENIINDVNSKDMNTFHSEKKTIIPQYSSGDIVQTKDGPLYRAKDIANIFLSTDTPEPAWRQTPNAAEKQLWMDRFKNEVFDQIDSKGRSIHISKMTPNAYKELGKFRTEWNAWSKDNQFIRELSDKPSTAYVEHLVRKEKGLDWFWSLPNEVRFRKGSRHSPNNVRILYDNRYKSLKDASEYILYNMQENTPPMNRLVIDLDIPKMKGKSITYKQAPRDIVIKRVDGTVVGRLGDYYDVLYAPYEELKEKLGTNINPRTNKPYININLSEKAIKDQISMWRTNILRGKISFIINQAPTLQGQTKKEKWQYQGSAIQQDMVDFLDEYKFLEPAKGFRKQLKSEPFQSSRGGKPIKTKKDELEGRFLTKTQEREIMNRKYRRSWFKRDLDDIFGPDRDDR